MNKILKSIYNSNLRIAVIGDSMLDEYFDVSVRKISPEFPIPVMHSDDENPSVVLPGGAANVAFQLKYFNKQTYLCSLLDFESSKILKKHGVDTTFSTEIPTNIPRKRRFYSGDFPTYRWDVEKHNYGLDDKDLLFYCKNLYDLILNEYFDVIIFSDYDKGVFYKNVVSELAKNHDCKIKIVDPKTDIYKWMGCTLIKPNSAEAKLITGEKEPQKQVEKLLSFTSANKIIVTNGGEGFYGYDDGLFDYKAQYKLDKANSVIGAGDCFIAFCGLCLGNHINLKDSAEFAFKMGSIYVQDKHNKPLDFERINKNLNCLESKFVDAEYFKSREYKLVMTNGCFDILHRGHIENLSYAKSQGDKLVVAVNSDKSVSNLKPNRPINNLKDRMLLLASMECVDYVVSFEEDTPFEIIKQIKPEVLVKGAEYANTGIVGQEFAQKIVYAPMIDNYSTSNILKNI